MNMDVDTCHAINVTKTKKMRDACRAHVCVQCILINKYQRSI